MNTRLSQLALAVLLSALPLIGQAQNSETRPASIRKAELLREAQGIEALAKRVGIDTYLMDKSVDRFAALAAGKSSLFSSSRSLAPILRMDMLSAKSDFKNEDSRRRVYKLKDTERARAASFFAAIEAEVSLLKTPLTLAAELKAFGPRGERLAEWLSDPRLTDPIQFRVSTEELETIQADILKMRKSKAKERLQEALALV